jgi:hydrogenase maturation protease
VTLGTIPAAAVLGLGNPLLRDDGVGLVLLEQLRARGPWRPHVELVDGGTWGMSLLPVLAEHARVLVLDAVRSGAAPGTVLRGDADDLPRLYRRRLSPHQIDLAEVLAAAELTGGVPADLVVVGVEPAAVDGPDVTLTDEVAAAVPRALAEAERILAGWGHVPPVRRHVPAEVPGPVLAGDRPG